MGRPASLQRTDIQTARASRSVGAIGEKTFVRGNPADIAELRRLLALFDVPAREFRLRVSTGSLMAETLALQGQSARLSRSSGATQLDLTLVGGTAVKP